MEEVPDMDELLDQLEAFDVCSSSTAISRPQDETLMNNTKRTDYTALKVIPSTNPGTCGQMFSSETADTSLANVLDQNIFINESFSPASSAEAPAIIQLSDSTAVEEDVGPNSSAEENSINLINLEPVNESEAAYCNGHVDYRPETATGGTMLVLEEIFASIITEEPKISECFSTSLKEKPDDQASLVSGDGDRDFDTVPCKSDRLQNTFQGPSDSEVAASSPTEHDFAEMDAYLSSCGEIEQRLHPVVGRLKESNGGSLSDDEENHPHKSKALARIRRFSDRAKKMIRKLSGGGTEKVGDSTIAPIEDEVEAVSVGSSEINEAFSENSEAEKDVEDQYKPGCVKKFEEFCSFNELDSVLNVHETVNPDTGQKTSNYVYEEGGEKIVIEELSGADIHCHQNVYSELRKSVVNGHDNSDVMEKPPLILLKESLPDLPEDEIRAESVEESTKEARFDGQRVQGEYCMTVKFRTAVSVEDDEAGVECCEGDHQIIQNVKQLGNDSLLCSSTENLDVSEREFQEILAPEADSLFLNENLVNEAECKHKEEFKITVSNNESIVGEDTQQESCVSQGVSENTDEEAQELLEDSVIQSAEDDISEPNEAIVASISVIESTHDISVASSNTRLTESELQLGKVKPEWIADAEMPACMLCCSKFTFLVRRHHCRSCGRLLCAQCTSQRAVLPYMDEPVKKFKVCDPCFQTLERIEKYEREKNGERSEAGVNDASTSAANNEATSRVTKSVLKVKSMTVEDDHDVLLSSSEGMKRCVKFRDGVAPGSTDAEPSSSSAGDASSHILKPKKVRTSVSKRLKELRMEEESVCFLPCNISGPLYYRNANGFVVRYESSAEILNAFAAGEVVVISVTRNLWCKIKKCELTCCHLGKVVCVTSCGMNLVGLDEILVVYEFFDIDEFSVPFEVVRRIYEIYKNALKPQDDTPFEKMGIREAHLRVPYFHSSDSNTKDDFVFRDLLLFRPSVQCFENLLIPDSPFLVGCFLQSSESIWAIAIPHRLLYRIGLQASYYPTPIVNKRSRESVYKNVVHTTVLKVFCDFKNWAYRMPMLYGSTVSLCDSETRVLIPYFAKEQMEKLINYNKNMVAWALDFNSKADSHLVCEQDENLHYRTQVFTSGNSIRKVTGASFIIIDGALKGSDAPVNVNVVEDGITVRLRSDMLSKVVDALSSGTNCRVDSSSTSFFIEWKDVEINGYPGELVSSVDRLPLMGKYQYGLCEDRVLSSHYVIPGVTDWALRLVCVYNCDDGCFSPTLRSKVFAVAEQIAAQIPYTLAPFVNCLIRKNLRSFFIRIHVTPEEAEYKAASWNNLEAEFGTWTELLDNQLVPGLFNVCSYISVGFTAEMCFALISTCSLP